jgi:predicted metal-dependent hydrolase
MVTIPGLLSFRAAHNFVASKKEWISSKLHIQVNANILSSEKPYNTRFHSLNFIPEARLNINVKIINGLINIHFPINFNEKDDIIQDAARRGIDLAYRIEAHQILPQRLESLAKANRYSYNRLSIKRTLTRWGSCSSKNNINLSIYLMKLPDELVDYIILHELAHTRVKNHKLEFWRELDTLTHGNAKAFAKKLKQYRTGV